MARQVLDALGEHGFTSEVVRVVDHDVKPGVEVDMGEGDEWPAIRERLMAADVLVVSTPTRFGHMGSVAQRVLERLDGELSETDDSGRPLVTGKVAVVCADARSPGAGLHAGPHRRPDQAASGSDGCSAGTGAAGPRRDNRSPSAAPSASRMTTAP